MSRASDRMCSGDGSPCTWGRMQHNGCLLLPTPMKAGRSRPDSSGAITSKSGHRMRRALKRHQSWSTTETGRESIANSSPITAGLRSGAVPNQTASNHASSRQNHPMWAHGKLLSGSRHIVNSRIPSWPSTPEVLYENYRPLCGRYGRRDSCGEDGIAFSLKKIVSFLCHFIGRLHEPR